MSIYNKTTATLIDELYTTELKIEYNPSWENKHRLTILQHAINNRLQGRWNNIEPTALILKHTLRKCWDAQEVVMSSENINDVYWAAKEAQRYNKERNKLIRKIDTILEEEEYTQLEKSY